MAKFGRRFMRRLNSSSYISDKGENKFLNKSNDFDEWCKLNRGRLIKIFADDVNLSEDNKVESMYDKICKVCEARFPQLKKDPQEDGLDCLGLLQLVFNIADSDMLIPIDIVFGNYNSLLVRANWFFNLYRSTDVDYLSNVAEDLKKETEDIDFYAQYTQGVKKVHSDLTTIIEKLKLEQALPIKSLAPTKKKTNKI